MKYRIGALFAASVLGAVLLPAAAANATEGFTCPTGTDAIQVPSGFTSDGQPILAGTVCVAEGTTRFVTLDTEAGWTAQVKSDGTGNNARTDVKFTQSSTNDHVELIYEPGRTVIK
jgi:hypothetical protein